MNTVRSYTTPGAGAIPTSQPVNSDPSPLPIGRDDQPPIFDRYAVHLDSAYLAQFERINPEEYERTGLVSVVDDSMDPQLMPNSTLLVVLVDQADYGVATGIVVVTLRSQPNRYFIRRAFAVGQGSIHLVPDNYSAWAELTVDQSDITSLCEVRYVIDKIPE